MTATRTSSALPAEAEKAHGLAVGQVRRRVGRKNTGIRVGEVTSKGRADGRRKCDAGQEG